MSQMVFFLRAATILIIVSPLVSPEPEKAWLRWVNPTPSDWSEQQPNAEGQNQQSDYNTNSAATPSPFKEQQIAGANQADKSDAEPNSVWEKAFTPEQWPRWCKLLIQIIAAMIAVGGVILLAIQVKIEHKGFRLSETEATTAQENSRLAQRPRISIEWLKFNVSKDRRTFKYSFIMANIGATPAQIFEMNYSWLGMTYESDEYISKMGGNVYGGPVVKEDMTIPPGQKIISTTSDPMPFIPEELPILYALGYVRYRDVFGSEYKTSFALKYTGDNTVPRLVSKHGLNAAT